MSDEAIRTPLHDVIAAQGGTHVADAGWLWAESFGDLDSEYRAARDDVATWDVSPMNKWDFRGPDALAAAQRVFSNDAMGLEIGQARYGALLDPDGLMVDDGTVFRLSDDHFFVMTNGMERQAYFEEHTTGMDVSIEWITPQICTIGVIGPGSSRSGSRSAGSRPTSRAPATAES